MSTLTGLIRRAVRETLKSEGAAGSHLTVKLTHDAELRALNHQFRGKDKPTNVLSFPSIPSSPRKRGSGGSPHTASTPEIPAQGGDDVYLGDIAVSMDTVQREALEQGKTVEDHLQHMIVHAVLHLLGHDHEEERQAEAMEAKEVSILRILGIKNPYL